MARFLVYILIPIFYLAFWGYWLWDTYSVYASKDPMLLELNYQREFIANRSFLLFSELAFPLVMSLFFLLLLILKGLRRRIRPLLLLAQALTLEFFIFRAFIFSDSYGAYHAGSEAMTPVEYLEPPTYWPWLAGATLLLLMMSLIRERDPLLKEMDGFSQGGSRSVEVRRF